MFDFGHISTVPDTSTSFSDMGETVCACPDTAHIATSAEKARNTFHDVEMRSRIMVPAVCIKYWARRSGSGTRTEIALLRQHPSSST